MARRPALTPVVPPERQSSRKRVVVNYNEAAIPGLTPEQTAGYQANVKYELPIRPRDDIEEEEDAGFDAGSEDADDLDDGLFHSRKQLLPAAVRRWNLSELMQCIDSNLLDLNPEYQRDVVWKPIAMSCLIDSIIEEYYIPPIIFKLEMRAGTDEIQKRVCVDGKQRLSSVHAFMKGVIPCHDRKGKKWYYSELENGVAPVHRANAGRRKVFTEAQQIAFRNMSFVCYEYRELSPLEEEDLFARVQRGTPLTAAEKLQAQSGDWQQLAKLFEKDFADVVNLAVTTRGTGFRNLLTSFAQIVEVQHPSRKDGRAMTKVQMPAVTSMCRNMKCDEASKSHLASVFSKFQELVELNPQTFKDNGYKIAKNFAPIEIVAVSVLLSLYMDTRNTAMLLGDIAAMRDEVRKAVPDLRMDNITWQSLWQYIEELESFRGASTGTAVKGTQRALPIPATSRIHAKATFHAARDQARANILPAAHQQQRPAGRVRTREASVDSVLGDDDSGTMEGVVIQQGQMSTQQTIPPRAVSQNSLSSIRPNRPPQQAPTATMHPEPPINPYTVQAATQPTAVRKVEYPATVQDTLQRAQVLQAKRQRLSRDKHQTKFS